MEYVFQRLNGHPSNHWVNKKKNLGLRLEGLYNTKEADQKDIQNLPSVSSRLNTEVSQQLEYEENKDFTSSFEIKKDLSNNSLTSENYHFKPVSDSNQLSIPELKNISIDVTPFENLNTCGKF